MPQQAAVNGPKRMVWMVMLVVTLQAIALIINAVLTLTDSESQELSGPAMYFLVFLFLLGALWLLNSVRGIYQGKAWPRGSLVVAQILAVIVSFTYFQIGDTLVGLGLLLSGGFVLIGLFTPALNEQLVQRRSVKED